MDCLTSSLVFQCPCGYCIAVWGLAIVALLEWWYICLSWLFHESFQVCLWESSNMSFLFLPHLYLMAYHHLVICSFRYESCCVALCISYIDMHVGMSLVMLMHQHLAPFLLFLYYCFLYNSLSTANQLCVYWLVYYAYFVRCILRNICWSQCDREAISFLNILTNGFWSLASLAKQ